MEQQNRPSAPQQVVNISHVPINKSLKDAYSTTAATILGVFQIIIGVLSFFGEVYVIQNHGPDLIFFSWRCIFWLGFCVLLCLRRNCNRRSTKWQQVPCGGHHEDEHHLRPVCTCSSDVCDLLGFQRFGPTLASRVGRATDPPIAEHGDRAHHLGLSRLQGFEVSEEAL